MASIDKVDNVAKASIARINDVPVANIEAVNNTDWTALPQPFVMTVDSTNLTSQTMTLGLRGSGSYNFDVDWGDGSAVQTITSATDPNRTHVYSASQVYTITLQPNTLTGLVEYAFGANDSPNNEHDSYREIISWGDMNISFGTSSMFRDCSNLNWNTATAGVPKFKSRVSAGNSFFRDCDALTADLSGWGTASNPISGNLQEIFFLSKPSSSPNFNFVANNITTLSSAFSASNYNAPLDNWDTSSCTNFRSCFSSALLFNQDISSWDLSSATDMRQMFSNARAFNQNINNWTIPSTVTSFQQLFNSCLAFNQPLDSWNTSSITDMQSCFFQNNVFNQDLNTWDVSNVTNMSSMFYNAGQFNGNISSWNTGNVTTMFRMFRRTAKAGGLDSWDVSSCTVFREMFFQVSAFQGSLSSWDTSSGTNFRSMFEGTPNSSLDASSWNVRNGTDFYRTFFNNAIGFDLSAWQVYGATSMVQMCGSGFSDRQCQDAFVAWSADALTARNVNATNIWGTRQYITGGAMEQATTTLTSAPYNWTVSGITFTGLLNTYTGSATAYSLRQLENSTTNVIEVRRDSDNATQLIGLVNGELDTATIASFCGSARGYVTLWVDQSGNGNDARQTAFTAQPMIYNGTAVVLENGKPALDCNSGRFMVMPNPPISNLSSTAVSVFNVIAPPDTTTDGVAYTLTDTAAIDNVISFGLNRVTGQYSANRYVNASTSLTITRSGDTHGVNQSLFTLESTGATNVTAYEDGVQATQTPTTSRGNFQNVLGANSATPVYPFNGTMQEWIIYPSNPNRKGVEDNINEYYSIY